MEEKSIDLPYIVVHAGFKLILKQKIIDCEIDCEKSCARDPEVSFLERRIVECFNFSTANLNILTLIHLMDMVEYTSPSVSTGGFEPSTLS